MSGDMILTLQPSFPAEFVVVMSFYLDMIHEHFGDGSRTRTACNYLSECNCEISLFICSGGLLHNGSTVREVCTASFFLAYESIGTEYCDPIEIKYRILNVAECGLLDFSASPVYAVSDESEEETFYDATSGSLLSEDEL